MDDPYSLDTGSRGSMLSRNAWLLIFFAIMFILYAFVPFIREPINSMLGTVFGPLIDMAGLVADSMSYL